MAGIVFCDCICGAPSGNCVRCTDGIAPAEFVATPTGVRPLAACGGPLASNGNNPDLRSWRVNSLGVNGVPIVLQRQQAVCGAAQQCCGWEGIVDGLISVAFFTNTTCSGTPHTTCSRLRYRMAIVGNPPSFASTRIDFEVVLDNTDPCFSVYGRPTPVLFAASLGFANTPLIDCLQQRVLTQSSGLFSTIYLWDIFAGPPQPFVTIAPNAGTTPAPSGDALIDAMGYTLDSARTELTRGGCCDAPRE